MGKDFNEKLASRIIVAEIEKERVRQRDLWGNDFDDKNTANDWAAYISNWVNVGAYSRRLEQFTSERFREHLIKAAALCIAAIEAIDRNGQCAPRHYEALKNAGAKTNI